MLASNIRLQERAVGEQEFNNHAAYADGEPRINHLIQPRSKMCRRCKKNNAIPPMGSSDPYDRRVHPYCWPCSKRYSSLFI